MSAAKAPPLKGQFEKMLAKKEDEHTKNQALYHKLLKDKQNIEAKLRPACDKASATANEVASLRAALASLPQEAESA